MMIPFILGGVALTATGYGVAKLLEEDCNCDKKSELFLKTWNVSKYDELIEKFEFIKVELYNTSLIELKIALNEIENFDKEIPITIFKPEKKVYPFEELTDDIKHSFERFTDILYKTKNYINSKLDSLDSLIVSESNYEKYSKEDKELVDELLELCTLIDKVSTSEITNDKSDISRKIKRGFIKIEQIIN